MTIKIYLFSLAAFFAFGGIVFAWTGLAAPLADVSGVELLRVLFSVIGFYMIILSAALAHVASKES